MILGRAEYLAEFARSFFEQVARNVGANLPIDEVSLDCDSSKAHIVEGTIIRFGENADRLAEFASCGEAYCVRRDDGTRRFLFVPGEGFDDYIERGSLPPFYFQRSEEYCSADDFFASHPGVVNWGERGKPPNEPKKIFASVGDESEMDVMPIDSRHHDIEESRLRINAADYRRDYGYGVAEVYCSREDANSLGGLRKRIMGGVAIQLLRDMSRRREEVLVGRFELFHSLVFYKRDISNMAYEVTYEDKFIGTLNCVERINDSQVSFALLVSDAVSQRTLEELVANPASIELRDFGGETYVRGDGSFDGQEFQPRKGKI